MKINFFFSLFLNKIKIIYEKFLKILFFKEKFKISSRSFNLIIKWGKFKIKFRK